MPDLRSKVLAVEDREPREVTPIGDTLKLGSITVPPAAAAIEWWIPTYPSDRNRVAKVMHARSSFVCLFGGRVLNGAHTHGRGGRTMMPTQPMRKGLVTGQ